MKKIIKQVLGSILSLSFLVACDSTSQQKKEYPEHNLYNSTNEDLDYANGLFNQTYVHEINVEISSEDWEDLLANPTEKTKYKVNVTIDGNKVEEVSFATKGNTSLTSVASSDSDRYSFKVNFGKYNKNQTYGGLDKLNLNNIYADTTYMKDYMAYEVFIAAGIEAALTSYVALSINGELFGLYLAIEEIGDAWIDRTQEGEGNLYKPEADELAMGDFNFDNKVFDPNGEGKMEIPEGFNPPTQGGQMPDGNVPEGLNPPAQGENMPSDFDPSTQGGQMPGGFDPSTQGEWNKEMPNGFGDGRFGSSSSAASLKYTDDNIDSYADIFDNAETDVTEEDQKRLIESLKNLTNQTNLSSTLDTEEIIRYFAAHNFLMNSDSYTGSMLHNYYLYENEGQLKMYPWDYNLAYGTFMGSNSNSIINYDIDEPLSSAKEEDRPMWAWIVSSDEYIEIYHEVFDELITTYFESGDCAKEITRVYNMIRDYVTNDPTKFYSLEEFDKGYAALLSFCDLRSQSVRLQLDGKESNIDASTLVINDMGTQGGDNKDKQKPQNNTK